MKNQQVINQTQYNEKPLEGIFDQELLGKLAHLRNQTDANGDGKSRQVSLALGELGYASRGLCISQENDLVQLPAFLEPRFDWIYRHLVAVGLKPSRQIIWDERLETTGELVAKENNLEPVLYMFGRKAHSIMPDEKRIMATEMANSKNDFMHLCASLGVMIPETFLYNSKTELADLKVFDYPVFLKSDVSVAGYGVVECTDAKALSEALANVEVGVRFQIQTKVRNVIASVNVQYRGINGRAKRFAISEQVLKQGKFHVGNRFPAALSPWEATDGIASVLARLGVKGIFAFDVVIDNRGRAFIIECNPRFNGASTPTLVGMSLGASAWQALTFDYHNDLNRLDLGKYAYSPKTKSGAVVLTWGVENKLGVMLIGSDTEQSKIKEGIKKVLS